ncbi:MAG: DUF2024 family protein [Saprospiraceae bacterium]|nr:DUF2024 family protein [Saprospiraceae bacterium]
MRPVLILTFALFGLSAAGQSSIASPLKTTAKMSVAVWDTYVKKRDGSVMHFDILVPSSLKDTRTIYQYGEEYLAGKNEAGGRLDIEECRFCHVEEAGADIKATIEAKGYFILEMEDIPAALPSNPTRRDMVLHLRAHYAQYRFADLRGKSETELKAMIQ